MFEFIVYFVIAFIILIIIVGGFFFGTIFGIENTSEAHCDNCNKKLTSKNISFSDKEILCMKCWRKQDDT